MWGAVLCKQQSGGAPLWWLQRETEDSPFLQKVDESLSRWSSHNRLKELPTFSFERHTPFVQLDRRIKNRISRDKQIHLTTKYFLGLRLQGARVYFPYIHLGSGLRPIVCSLSTYYLQMTVVCGQHLITEQWPPTPYNTL